MIYPSFFYVDMNRFINKGGTIKPTSWTRVKMDDVSDYASRMMEDANTVHIFSTIQRFAMPAHESDEDHISPLYMDFDSEDPEKCRIEVIRLLLYLNDKYLIEDEESGLKIWFSGNKGFHLTIDEELFDAQPYHEMNKIWLSIAKDIQQDLSLSTLDMTVYSKRRMWRVENTLHGKSKLYKVRLYPGELHLGMAKIKDIAKHPREVHNGGIE